MARDELVPAPGAPVTAIAGAWRDGSGPVLQLRGPMGEARPALASATAAEVDAAVASAREAWPAWAARDQHERLAILERFAELVRGHADALAAVLGEEVGKPRWECLEEVAAVAGKIGLTAAAFGARAAEQRSDHAGFVGVLRYRPHGVFAVFSPFNLPMHLPNGHIAPALLGGNAVVVKSSEYAPRSAAALVRLLHLAGVPHEVVHVVAGGRDTGEALVGHRDVDGVAFTGSSAVGRQIHRALGGRPEVMVALEMGGNNPMVILPDVAPAVAGPLVALSSLLTSGQRCTSARRIIVPRGAPGDAIVAAVVASVAGVRVAPTAAEPAGLCGPLVSPEAAERVLAAWRQRLDLGGVPLWEPRLLPWSPAALTPGVIDVSAVGAALPDEEVFGPLLHVVRVDDFAEACAVAAATRHGLSAALIGGGPEQFEAFRGQVRAGIVNRNRPTNGALSTMPFGGFGWSGNHRPAGFFAVDACVWPAASTEAPAPALPASLPPGLTVPA